jgi:hypothetical protein
VQVEREEQRIDARDEDRHDREGGVNVRAHLVIDRRGVR